jgi:hypothetical protein
MHVRRHYTSRSPCSPLLRLRHHLPGRRRRALLLTRSPTCGVATPHVGATLPPRVLDCQPWSWLGPTSGTTTRDPCTTHLSLVSLFGVAPAGHARGKQAISFTASWGVF